MVDNIHQILNFIYDCVIKKYKIILLDETGKDNSIFVTIMFLMKYHNVNFDSIYSSISNYTYIHPKEYYNSICSIEYFIINTTNINTNTNTNTINYLGNNNISLFVRK